MGGGYSLDWPNGGPLPTEEPRSSTPRDGGSNSAPPPGDDGKTDYEDILGYDPTAGGNVGFGPANAAEYAADFATTYANKWANGSIFDTAAAQTGIFDDPYAGSIQDKAGIGTLDKTEFGSGIASQQTWNQLYKLGEWIATNYGSLSDYGKQVFPEPPSGDGLGGLSEDDKQRIFEGTQAEENRDLERELEAGRNARAAQDAAARVSAASIAANAQVRAAQIRAAVDREAIAVQREELGVRREEEAGRNRRFDLQLAEDRRQFNEDMRFRWTQFEENKTQFRATFLAGLLDRGIELSRRPVDWIAHQFFMENMGVPLTALGFTSSAAVFGAIPPSGPSASGPVVGGPAAMDGDTTLAQLLGVQAGFVSVSQAVAENPGGTVFPDPVQTADATAQQIAAALGSLDALDQAVEQARIGELPGAVEPSPVLEEAIQRATTAVTAPITAVPSPPAGGASPPTIPNAETAPTPAPAAPPAAAPSVAVAPPASTATAPPTVPGVQPSTGAGDQNTGGANRGIFVGEAASTPATTGAFGTTQAAAQSNPQGEALLQSIAEETGIDINQLRKLVPPHLLAGGYSKEVIENTPVIRAIREGTALSNFRTAPVTPNSRLGNISAFGIPLGIRGGQDLNASTFLKASNVDQGLIQGAIEGAGFDFQNTLRQSLRTSPVTNIQPGSFGVRRF